MFDYDMTGRFVGSQVYDTQTYKTCYDSHVKYDEDSRVRKISYQAQYKYGTLDKSALAQQAYTFGYSNATGNLETLTFADNAGLTGTMSLAYNSFGMTTERSWNFAQSGNTVHQSSQQYEYQTVGDNQTALVSKLTVQIEEHDPTNNTTTTTTTKYGFVYDANGNITRITDGTPMYSFNVDQITLYRYTYDLQGLLVREDNRPKNASYTYDYDSAGNLLRKQVYEFTCGELGYPISTKNYIYDNATWGDLLTEIGSDSIEYDEIGNPTIWGQKNEDNIWYNGAILEWQGRQLQTFQPFNEYDDGMGDMYYPVQFEYNDEGIRTRKVQDSEDHEYILDGSKIVGEWIHNRTILILYIYDEVGSPIGMKMRTASQTKGVFDEYFFEKNLQGDIVAVYNSEGEKIGTYTYDAWGNFTVTTTSTNIAAESNVVRTYNPFRYRGYYYDVETGLYYLQSRYYNPTWGRFINVDHWVVMQATPFDLTDKNLFAYCDNNPVVRIDSDGQFWDYVLDIGFLIWSVVDVINDPGDWKNWVALGVDVVFAVVPFVPSGVGQVIKAGNKIDNALDVANAINKVDNIQDIAKVTMVGRKMDRVTNTAKLIGKADNLYKVWKGYDRTATGIKKIAHNGYSMFHNGRWLLGKLRQGYTVIDIGLSVTTKGRGLWYGTERVVLGLWETRNIWKLPINYYF
ncbi:MAG: RHS repeat-associated core domain-containing protein [Ruminococcaceae bacterium]|nr:RHS repeat-associated core domain-containing protein [Oscillospiraceae bacterium]